MKQISTLIVTFIFFVSSAYSEIKIGTLAYDPPFVISPTEGFDIDLSRLICKYLQEQCRLMQRANTKQLYQALEEGKIDLAIAGITISQARQNNFVFTLPYMLNKSQFLTLKSNNINSINELKGTTVGVIRDQLSGGVLYNYLLNHYQKQFKINQYGNVEELLASLNNKTLSAVFLYRSDVNYWNQNGGDSFKPLGSVITLGEGLAIMALPKNNQLISRINAVLLQMENNNIYLAVYKTYFSNE
ncbi:MULTISPECIES: transporter substrate-binding domain-containing protein [unclassified Legionella]|uniref:transporter substrate-binding domain-containing protein n=1 Tax=unclassified Legionella TaxID=2622702 RepID=UPI001E2F5D4E|nr:transporter substrate-binding domain-containing protein [Legionella sp. 31fI33]MCC5013806.1 transporter substrate-binding domain-containing protein [Legionella sp. 31fI33]